jgi:hypothetical protein
MREHADMFDRGDLEHRFNFHPATHAKGELHAQVRGSILNVALYINAVVPDGREKALAITKLEEAMMWANAAIARNDLPSQQES